MLTINQELLSSIDSVQGPFWVYHFIDEETEARRDWIYSPTAIELESII